MANDPERAVELLREAVGSGDVALVVLTERIARAIRAEVDAVSEKRDFPLVVEIPDSEGPLPDRQSPDDIVRQAIGINI